MSSITKHRNRVFAAAAPILLIAVSLFFPGSAHAGQAGQSGMRAALLTEELGDPKTPGNLKIAMTLPPEMTGPGAKLDAGAFQVHVYPDNLPPGVGLTDRYKAAGLYYWRDGSKIFLDVRGVPTQDGECKATVRVAYAPDGQVLAENTFHGQASYTNQNVDVVLAVDVSLSMNFKDPDKRRVTAARMFLDMARQGGGVGRVALVTFNHQANLVTPLIPLEQGERLLSDLDNVGAEGLTNLDDPLEFGLRELKDSRRPVIILLTDGKNEGHEYADAHLKAAKAGVRIFAVGLSEQADHALLKKMAEATDGIYFRAIDDKDLPEIYARLAAELGKRHLLQAEPLTSRTGQAVHPIDASVRHMVAIADHGARVRLTGPGGATVADSGSKSGMDSRDGGVHMGNPKPGRWEFQWEDASPGESTLAVFGDTRFFLDVFPPQLRGDRLAVGATLAMGADPLRGGDAWVEAIPGIMPEPLKLYDDGKHDDGEAGDGVYGNVMELNPGVPDTFDLTVRAAGKAWRFGRFVRQTQGLTIRSDEPPPPKASLEGDLDFGVLYPGETGTAIARVNLKSHKPHDLDLHLGWENAPEWPVLSSVVPLSPGKRALELEMTVPDDARAGDYSGRFRIGDGHELNAESSARLRVGGVKFDHSGAVDFGVVPPGTFVSKVVEIPYHADKAVGLRVDAGGGEDLTINDYSKRLEAGPGVLTFEAVVSVPMGSAGGEYSAEVELTAGPGRIVVPVQWRVAKYATRPLDIEPVAGVPKPPQLGKDTKPLSGPSGLSEELWNPDEPGHLVESLPSPWEKVSDLFEGSDQPRTGATGPAIFDFDKLKTPKHKGSNFWSAWWMYILAALLLLLLLLLLLAYILYRLGKSAWARFLLASAIANIVMLIVFIALLSTALTEAPKPQQSIMVNLVENDELPNEVQFTEAEKTMLDSTGTNSASSASGGGVEAASTSLQQDSGSSGGADNLLPSEKTANLPDGMEQGMRLALATNAEPMPLKSEDSRNMTRRERRRERTQAAQPAHDMPEMDEPPRQQAERRDSERSDQRHEVVEARLSVDAATDSQRAVWSDGERPQTAAVAAQGAVFNTSPGATLEKVSMDRLVKRLDPKGRRTNHKETPVEPPEPRIEIDDPARDSLEVAAHSESQQENAQPGVQELRAETRALGADVIGRKPGAVLPPGVSEIVYTKLEPMPRGEPGGELAVNTSSLGERRNARGTSARAGSTLPERDATMPGSLNRGNKGAPGGGKSASSGRSRGGRADGVGEQRFDGLPGGSDGFDGDVPGGRDSGGDAGAPNGSGNSGLPASMAGGGAAPNPFAGGGSGNGDRMDFQPSATAGRGDNGGGLDDRRGQPRRGNGNGNDNGTNDGDSPQGLAGLPGGTPGGASANPGGNGSGGGGSRGRGRGVGEGRYDGMAKVGSTGLAQKGGGAGEPGQGRSNLAGSGGGGGLEFMPLPEDKSDWKRNERRQRRRAVSVAASSVDTDSLLIVVGDFSRTGDKASENLFASLDERLGQGLAVEERVLSPADPSLNDCLLALTTPEEVRDWSDNDIEKVAEYLKRGGHIWMDASRTDQAEAFMSRLRSATGGDYGELPARHQLNDDEIVDALHIDGRLAAVVTYQDWRRSWRYGKPPEGERALRFLVRGLNYFLSGDAETGISLEPSALATSDVYVEPSRERMPDSLSGPVADAGRVWDEFGPETAAEWKMPGWSDPGRISAISDGMGGRALRIDLNSAKKGRAAAYRTLNPPQDFSGAEAVSFDAYYSGDGEAAVSMVFTVRDFDGWSDYETPTVTLKPGWNTIRFRMTGRNFRALSDDGDEGHALPGAARTGRAGFFVYRDVDKPAVALFRNIRLH